MGSPASIALHSRSEYIGDRQCCILTIRDSVEEFDRQHKNQAATLSAT